MTLLHSSRFRHMPRYASRHYEAGIFARGVALGFCGAALMVALAWLLEGLK